jgi:hypothetical protein
LPVSGSTLIRPDTSGSRLIWLIIP